MGDVRFEESYRRILESPLGVDVVHDLSDEEVVMALAAASRSGHPLHANILATEALNRIHRLRAALAHLGEGVVSLGLDRTISWANPAAERLLGAPRERLVGAHFETLVGGPIELGSHDEVYFHRPDGGFVCVAYTADAIVGEAGDVEGFVVSFADQEARLRAARELREGRERYQTLFQEIPYGVISIDLEGRIVEANPAAEEATGRPIDESRGMPFFAYVHPDDVDRTRELFAQIVAGERRRTPMRILHKQGHYIEVDAVGVPVRVGGIVVGVHGLMMPAGSTDTSAGSP